jgi:hypothetical protein
MNELLCSRLHKTPAEVFSSSNSADLGEQMKKRAIILSLEAVSRAYEDYVKTNRVWELSESRWPYGETITWTRINRPRPQGAKRQPNKRKAHETARATSCSIDPGSATEVDTIMTNKAIADALDQQNTRRSASSSTSPRWPAVAIDVDEPKITYENTHATPTLLKYGVATQVANQAEDYDRREYQNALDDFDPKRSSPPHSDWGYIQYEDHFTRVVNNGANYMSPTNSSNPLLSYPLLPE